MPLSAATYRACIRKGTRSGKLRPGWTRANPDDRSFTTRLARRAVKLFSGCGPQTSCVRRGVQARAQLFVSQGTHEITGLFIFSGRATAMQAPARPMCWLVVPVLSRVSSHTRATILTNVDFTAAIADAKLICNLHRFAAVNEAATTARVRLCHITLPQPSRSDGTTENARPENAGRSKMQGVENEYGKLVCE